MIDNYKVITLCGSTKFKNEFIKVQKELTLKGYIVISVGLFGHSGDDEVWDDGIKEMLDDMHKRKIDMADEIMVIDVNDYIGESTKKEIEYAKSKGKFISFYNHPECHYDDIGGFHDSGMGWNPNGNWCGECSKSTCRECPNVQMSKEMSKIKKFKMDLTWHNCYEHPPEEDYNDNLIATNGVQVFKVKYDKNVGWFNLDNVRFLPFELLCEYWWADITQTVQNCSDFK